MPRLWPPLGWGYVSMGTSDPQLPAPFMGVGSRPGSLPGLAEVPTIPLSVSETRRGLGPSPTPFPQCQGEEQMASLGVLLLPSPSFHFWLLLSLCRCISASLGVQRSVHVPVCACLFMGMRTRVCCTSFKPMSEAGPSHTSLCSNFPVFFYFLFLLYLLKKS